MTGHVVASPSLLLEQPDCAWLRDALVRLLELGELDRFVGVRDRARQLVVTLDTVAKSGSAATSFPWGDNDGVVSYQQAASYLNKSLRSVRQYVHDGRLTPVWVGGTPRFKTDDLERFAQETRP